MITVAGLFAQVSQARQAVLDLVTSAVPHEDISVVMPESAGGDDDFVASLIGARRLDMPGVGPVVVAGPLAETLAGAGDLQSALAGVVASADPAQAYVEGLSRGQTLLVIQSDNERAVLIHGAFRHNHVLDSDVQLPPEHGPGATLDDEAAADVDVDIEDAPPPVSTSIGALTSGFVPGGAGPADTVFNPDPDDIRR